MGQGGYVAIVNATKYDMVSTYNHSYQMNAWKFPDKIAAGTTEKIYVEWGASGHTADDAGEQDYTLNGNKTFRIEARNTKDYNISVLLKTFGTKTCPKGTLIDLGWVHDGNVTFILSGNIDSMSSTGNYGSWMHDNLDLLYTRKLREICIPGSHDAGMSEFNSHTAGAFKCNTITQTKSIYDQLVLGSRYFDIRPVISAGKFVTGHYSQVGPSWQGANGQSIKDIIDNVNSFTKDNRELVILYLSHDLNTDLGNMSYAPLTQDDWDKLLKKLSDLNFLCHASPNTDLTKVTINDYIGSNRASVIVIVDADGKDIKLGDYEGKGFFKPACLKVYNKYSDTNDLDKMEDDQLDKMKKHRGGSDKDYFLLSWTLTQSDWQALSCGSQTTDSILDLAKKAIPPLDHKLFNHISKDCYPNIIYTDNVHDNNVGPMAMAVNCKAIF